MRRSISILAVISVLLLINTVSCKQKSKIGEATVASENSATELALPVIPDSLKTKEERADYLITHYWDNLDFSNKKQTGDSAYMEQSFSNYVSIMELCDRESLHNSVYQLLKRAEASGIYEHITYLAEKYLREASSPFRSDESYLPFVDYALDKSNGEDERAKEIRAEIFRNQPGSTAPNLALENRSGKQIQLIKSGAAPMTIIMFYEPDCEYCKAAIDALIKSQEFTEAVADKRVRFVAVYIGDEKKLWKEHAETLPSSWEVAIDMNRTIDNDELYVVRSTPSFYLLDDSNRIILKDADIQQLSNYLGI